VKGLNGLKEKLHSLDEKQSYAVLVGIICLILILDYFLLLGPQIGALNKISPEINILSKDIKEAKNNVLRIDQYNEQVGKLKDQLQDLNVHVISREEVPLILMTISTLAYQNGVKIDQIMPVSENQNLILDNNDRKYYSFPIHVQAQSGYHNFGRFINKIEQETIHLEIGSFSIASVQDSKHHMINLTLEAVIYEDVKKEVGAKRSDQ